MHAFTRPVPVRALAIALPVVLAACGDPAPPVDPGPSQPVWLSVSPDSVRLRSYGERARFHASVRPEPAAGTAVRWSSTDTSVITVDEEGEATAVGEGVAGVVAELSSLRDTAVVVMRQEVGRLEVVREGQRAGAGQPLPQRVGVRVLDAGGNLFVGVTTRVYFDASADGGRANPADALWWPAREEVTWTEWTLGPDPGQQTLGARVRATRVTAEIGAVALEPDSVVSAVVAKSGEGQGAPAGEALSEPVVVAVVDTLGRRVPGATVRFEPAPGHGRAEPAETRSDGEGAAATRWTLGEAPGAQTLVVRAGAGASVEIGATAQSGEGVCPRTPAVAEEIVRLAGAANCAEVTEADLAGIRELNLARRGIASLRSGDFAGLTGMRGLGLEYNSLTELPPDLFQGLLKVGYLRLNANHLTELPPDVFRGLTGLWGLFLRDNALTELPQGVFAGLRLGQLWLDGNRLGELPPDIFDGLNSLFDLKLGGNALTELPPTVFEGLNLSSLDLGINRLEALPPRIFASMPRLRWLYLDQNRLTELPPGIFDGLANLKQLDLYGLGVRGTVFELPPGIFVDLERLEVLNLRGTKVRDFRPDVFEHLTELRELDIAHTFPPGLPPGVFRGLGKLRELKLYYNELTELPPRMFVGLHGLESVVAHLNPGSPFPVRVELARSDTADVLAAGPARVVMRVPDGSPFALRMPVRVQLGSASAPWLEVGPGDTVSTPLLVERPAGSTEAVHLSFGQLSELPREFVGLEVAAGGPLALFAPSDNRSPVVAEQIRVHWLQAGGAPVELALAPHFSDPDGDSLAYETRTEDGGRVAGASISGGALWIEPRAEGEVELVVEARDPRGLRASQRMRVVVAPPANPDRFDIHLLFGRDFPEAFRTQVRRAADRWEEVVTGDLPDVPFSHLERNGGPRLEGTVDDLVIINDYQYGDFYSALAGDCAVREESKLTLCGVIQWQPDFIEAQSHARHYSVALHEMGHILGFGGSRWGDMYRVLEGTSPPERYFPGTLAVAAFNAAGGLEYDGPRVPLDERIVSHWHGGVIGYEIMGSNAPCISAITVQALADVGHVVDVGKADPYTLSGGCANNAAGDAAAAYGADGQMIVELADDILREPVMVVDSTGKVVRIIRN